ncbi:VTT domain-containing protein [Gorillibacterium massiliense]|uniref:VTT domain-containing protein n=1 Tax=Gorillibacterium massiliense TaxID=1280390 RepID=UPI0004B99CFD|nr:VTT domain-containing protein [Gorillibacterium massiliense]
MNFINDWMTHLLVMYGYWVLFFAPFLEMMALPLPGELIMTYSGLIVYEGQINWLFSILVAGTAVSLGMTASYAIGYRLGHPFFEKYGARFHFGPDKLNSVSKWFDRYGNKMLIFAYFIPGVRHLTGYFSGTTRVPFRKYAAYAYPGAFFWVFTFITLGKLIGPEWKQYHSIINQYMIIFGLLTAIAYLLFTMIRKYFSQIQTRVVFLLQKAVHHYQSIGKIQLLILSAGLLFIVFFSFMIGLIQDFLDHEFTHFDEVASYVIGRMFTPDWMLTINHLSVFSSYPFLLLPMLATAVWIGFLGKNRILELVFFIAVIVGGEGLDEGLRSLFHRMGPSGSQLTFPSEQIFMAFTVYGFSVFLMFRHHREKRYQLAATLVFIAFCLFIGVNTIYRGINYPSDVAAGFVFGGLWITLNVAVLEIFRLIRSKRLWPRTKLAI